MYTFQQAADAARLCMQEITERGLDERKILLKTEQSSFLLNKFMKEKVCDIHDLRCESIHRVATLMKDILWLCPDRIISRKAWRSINYQTCMIENLGNIISHDAMAFVLEMMDFLLKVMNHKSRNIMTARRLGEAMGKVTFGPRDCNHMMAERCSNLVTKLLIERSRKGYANYSPTLYCLDKAGSPVIAERSARLASKKSFERIAQRTNDWSKNLNGVTELFDPSFNYDLQDELQYISIFSTELSAEEMEFGDPTLVRMVHNINENCKVMQCDDSIDSDSGLSYDYSDTIVNELEIRDLPSFDTSNNVHMYCNKKQSKRLTWSLGEALGLKTSSPKKSKEMLDKNKMRPKSLITGVNRQITRIRSLKNLSLV
ncbi:hypothetical protein BC943DRAFT_360213 [Umbelopsis sp. AD052]|nr:hypothetical protein BC943DRAFT_360213 [Umbelopsis sp. AD052]